MGQKSTTAPIWDADGTQHHSLAAHFTLYEFKVHPAIEVQDTEAL